MPNKNIAEILIRRYVYANEARIVPKVSFKIARCFDVLASGYVTLGDKSALAKAVKEAKLHYPTEAELEDLKKAEAEKRQREVKRIQAMPKFRTTGAAKKKKKTVPLKEVVEVEVTEEKEDGKLPEPKLSEVSRN